MLFVKLIFAIALIPYTYLAIDQSLDSDFGVYVHMYENFRFLDYENQPLMGIIFLLGNFLNLDVFIYFFLILYIPFIIFYNNIINLSININRSYFNKIFIIMFSLLFLTYIQPPIMYGHLMRQNIATIVFLLLLNKNYLLASVFACLIHLSFLPIIIINSIQSLFKINYSKNLNILLTILITLSIYLFNSRLENGIQIESSTGIFWVDNFFSSYSIYNDSYGSLIGLRLFLLTTYILGAKFLDFNIFIQRQIYYSFISCMILSAILSFSEVLSYRFLIPAKYLAFCVNILFISKIFFNVNFRTKKYG